MTTYLGEKAVGVGTIKTYVAVADVLHDNTLVGNGNTEPLGVNTKNIVSQQTLANTISVLNTAIDGQADAIAKTRNDFEVADQEIRAEMADLQTQVTAQIAGKQDKLTAGEGIKIENNVISATGGGGSGSANVVHDSTLTGAGTSASPLGLSEAVKDEIADKAPKETVEALTTAVNDIYTGLAGKQDKLTAGENITIEDGVISATGGGASLPDQTGNAGKFLMTDGANVSWSQDIILTDNSISTPYYGVTLVGRFSMAKDAYSTAVGFRARAKYKAVALGNSAQADANNSIQLGTGTNSDNNTFKVANANGNFEMMDANGNVPLDRLTYVTDQIGDISTALTAILGE
jgi:hypothetical protein